MSVFAARTCLPPEWGVEEADVEPHLETLRQRWNQFGFEARVRTGAGSDGVFVRYRLSVAGPGEPGAVHAAFREDVRRALHGLRPAGALPVSWDLEAMARARTDDTATPLEFESDDPAEWDG
ncbi:MAG: hypothetical protein ACR2KV_15515 [Solirubrobacteraceae bacterium]